MGWMDFIEDPDSIITLNPPSTDRQNENYMCAASFHNFMIQGILPFRKSFLHRKIDMRNYDVDYFHSQKILFSINKNEPTLSQRYFFPLNALSLSQMIIHTSLYFSNDFKHSWQLWERKWNWSRCDACPYTVFINWTINNSIELSQHVHRSVRQFLL